MTKRGDLEDDKESEEEEGTIMCGGVVFVTG
jgi:hypothetical protein